MIKPDVRLDVWLAKTGLQVSDYKCSNCGEIFQTNVPICSFDYYGVESPIHDPCGKGFTKKIVTPRSKRKKDLWGEILGA